MRAFPFLAKIVVATLTCHLAYLTAGFLILVLPHLILADFTDVEIIRFYYRWPLPGIRTLFPSDGSPLLYAAHRAGFLLSGTAGILAALAGLKIAAGWSRLFLINSILWLGTWLIYLLALFQFSPRPFTSRSAFGSALHVLWPGAFTDPSIRIIPATVALALVFAAVLAVLGAILKVELNRIQRLVVAGFWLGIPMAAVGYVTNFETTRWWGYPRWIAIGAPVILILATWVSRERLRHRIEGPFRPRLAAAPALLLVWGLVFAGLWNLNRWSPSTEKPSYVSHQSRYWQIYVVSNASEKVKISETAEAADRRVERFAERLGIDLEKNPNPKLNAYLYTSPESKRLATESDFPFNVKGEDRLVHHVLERNSAVADPRGDAVLLMQVTWGPVKAKAAPVARALAGYALGRYHDYQLADYAGRITREERKYSLREIFQLGTPYLSPQVRDALCGAWVEFQEAQRGREILRTLYQAGLEEGKEEAFAQALGVSWTELENEWAAYLDRLAAVPAPSSGISAAEPFFHKGITFSHEMRRSAGYGSEAAARELTKIHELGANSIALVPYAFTLAPAETSIRFRTSETDFRVIRALRAAREAGLRVVLKPQLWARRFTGDIVFDDTKDFHQWFRFYRRWLLHFARLAELHEADLLVIGTELGGVTGPEHEEAWRGLIADIRRIYSGPLTYAAHWDTEFGNLPFWDALDYLGLNMYYPLAKDSETPRADSARVTKFVERVEDLSRKYGKQVLLTEVGFSSTTEAATKPWAENGGALDLELQRQCYEVIFQAFYDRPWFAGLYWWKWPSHGYGHPYDGSHSPVGKPAAKALASWYGRKVD